MPHDLYVVRFSTEMVVVSTDAADANRKANLAFHGSTQRPSMESTPAELLRAIPHRWRLDDIPYGFRDPADPDRTICGWLDRRSFRPLAVAQDHLRDWVIPDCGNTSCELGSMVIGTAAPTTSAAAVGFASRPHDAARCVPPTLLGSGRTLGDLEYVDPFDTPSPREQLRASLEANSRVVASWPAEVRAAIDTSDALRLRPVRSCSEEELGTGIVRWPVFESRFMSFSGRGPWTDGGTESISGDEVA
jgi:hypothetical protein